MPNPRYKAGQIANLLRKIEVAIPNVKTTPQAAREQRRKMADRCDCLRLSTSSRGGAWQFRRCEYGAAKK